MSQPRLAESEVRKILTANNVNQLKVCVVAIRGYRLDSMGVPGKNDRKIYDDATFICWPGGIAAYNSNADPNGYRKGSGTVSGKGMANLKDGIHLYGTGLHKGRLAFTQTEVFTVIRDGDPPYEDCGWHAINLHDGGYTSTSSLGCQTIPKGTWGEFRPLLYSLLDRFKNPYRKNARGERVRSFPYVLISETNRRAGKLVVSQRYL